MRMWGLSIVLTGGMLAALFLHLDVRDHYYAMPIAKVNGVIDHTYLPAMIFADRAYNARHWRAGPTTSMWAVVGRSGQELLRLSAETIPDGDEVRVHVEALPPPGEHRDLVADSPSNIALLTTALAEQIDADLNGREFDLKRIAPAVARVTLENLPHLREQADAAVKDSDRREQENIDRAYANEKPAP
jgi:hypothetical protein